MDTLQLLCMIHEANSGMNDPSAPEEITQILKEYDCLVPSNLPPWFDEMLQAVVAHQQRRFKFRRSDDLAESNAASILLELKDRLNWEVEDEGEWARLRFARSQIEVLIQREGATVCLVRHRDGPSWADWQTWARFAETDEKPQ